MIESTFSDVEILAKEEKSEYFKKDKCSSIGIPKEVNLEERRLCMTPDAVQVLVSRGHKVVIERGAGDSSFYSDLQYSEVGAIVTEDKKEVLSQSIILKINPPTFQEIEYFTPNSYLISAIQFNLQKKEYFLALSDKKINAIAFELITDENGEKTLLNLISQIAGNRAVLHAAELLAHHNGLMLGGVTGVRPTDVVVLGAGVLGEYIVKSVIGLGASVRVFDKELSKLKKLQSTLNCNISTSMIDPKELAKALMRTDVLINALTHLGSIPIVTEDMIMTMKKGSVIVDLTVDAGSAIETSELTIGKESFVMKYDIVHSGIPNITSKIPRTTTKAISNFFLNYFLYCNQEGGIEKMISKNQHIKNSFYIYKGKHTNKKICERFGMVYHDINLLVF